MYTVSSHSIQIGINRPTRCIMSAVPKTIQFVVIYLLSFEVCSAALIVKPVDTVALEGSNLSMNCSTNSSNTINPASTAFINWYNNTVCAAATVTCPANYTILRLGLITASSRFNVIVTDRPTGERIRNLDIKLVQHSDAANYVCHDLGPGDEAAVGRLVVLGGLPNCSVNTTVSLPADNISLTCIIRYSGNISVRLNFLNAAHEQITTGQVLSSIGSNDAIYWLQYVLTTTMEAVNRATCVATFMFVSTSINFSGECPIITVAQKPNSVRLVDERPQYAVGETIQCVADGVPTPSYKWSDVSNPIVIITGAILPIVSSMEGQNFTFECAAANVINGRIYISRSTFSFVVQGYVALTTALSKPSTESFMCATDRDGYNVAKNAAIAVGVIAAVSIVFNALQLIHFMRTRTPQSVPKIQRSGSDRAKDGTAVDESQMYADLSPSTRDTVQSAPYEPLDFQRNRTYANIQEK